MLWAGKKVFKKVLLSACCNGSESLLAKYSVNKSHLMVFSSCSSVARARLSFSWLISAWLRSISWSLEQTRSQAVWCSSCSWVLVVSACSARAISFFSCDSRSFTCSDRRVGTRSTRNVVLSKNQYWFPHAAKFKQCYLCPFVTRYQHLKVQCN